MLSKLLNITKPIVCVDCETTGLDVQTCRVVELAFQVFYHDGRPIKEWHTLIRTDVQISAEVSAIHGITSDTLGNCQICRHSKDEHPVMQCEEIVGPCETFKPWPTFKQLAASLAKGFTDVDFCGQNVRYDLRILQAEMNRCNQPWSYAGAKVIDSKVLEQLAVPRTLSALYKKYTGQDHDGAHGAMADVKATVDVITGQLSTYLTIPRDVEKLHAAQWPGWIDSEGKFVFVNGVPCFSRWGKYGGRPMRDPEVNRPGRNGTYWDFILGGTFGEDVKQIASDAKLGKFPEAK